MRLSNILIHSTILWALESTILLHKFLGCLFRSLLFFSRYSYGLVSLVHFAALLFALSILELCVPFSFFQTISLPFSIICLYLFCQWNFRFPRWNNYSFVLHQSCSRVCLTNVYSHSHWWWWWWWWWRWIKPFRTYTKNQLSCYMVPNDSIECLELNTKLTNHQMHEGTTTTINCSSKNVITWNGHQSVHYGWRSCSTSNVFHAMNPKS